MVASGRELALALARGATDVHLMLDVALGPMDWDGIATPVVLTSNTTIQGTSSRPLPVVVDLRYEKNRVRTTTPTTPPLPPHPYHPTPARSSCATV